MAAGVVLLYQTERGRFLPEEVRSVIVAVAESIAALTGYAFGGHYRAEARPPDATVLLVPDDTLVAEEATQLGIVDTASFFGGVVPKPFVKTKAITHELVDNRAARPVGWSAGFGKMVRPVVLPGFTAFTHEDAHAAFRLLIAQGPVRLKPPLRASGVGQVVIKHLADLDVFLDNLGPRELRSFGVVLEANLCEVRTLNIGHVRVGPYALCYYGTQRAASGGEEYGGSDISCVAGDWAALDALPLAPDIRLAIRQARAYDAATSAYHGFMASRRNYDVGQGLDASGRWRSGVLEASWRVGAASTAELAALMVLARDPSIRLVEASAIRTVGAPCPPEHASVHFRDHDPKRGPITRYTIITRAVSDRAL